MFTPEGDRRVIEICATSPTVDAAYAKLRELWKDDRFKECYDTEVRDAVAEWFESFKNN